MDNITKEQIYMLFESDLNATQVASKFNLKPDVVRYWWLKKYGKEAYSLKTHNTHVNHAKTIGKKNRKPIVLCSVKNCNQVKKYKTGLCPKHHRRYTKHKDPTIGGIPDNRITVGSVSPDGYRVIRIRKNGKSKVMLEHRYIMETLLGRALQKDEYVHHLNGNRLDNNPANLELWTTSHPIGQRVSDLVEWARGIITRYETSKFI